MNILHQLWRRLYGVFTDALFPLSKNEELLATMSPEEAYVLLPKAPAYDGSVLPLPNTCSVFAYKDERVSRLVWNIKYKNSRHSVEIGGYALRKALDQLVAEKVVLVSIPTTAKRLRERGYNQCDLLIGEIVRLDTTGRFQSAQNLLVRTRDGSRNKTKGRNERLETTKGIFAVDPQVALEIQKDTCLVVIDDVITTGSTMKESFDILKDAGFTDVRGLSLAH